MGPVGDCRFARDGTKLTITVSGKGHGMDFLQGWLLAPRLLRGAEGDFVMQVRVGGDFGPLKGERGRALRRAGLLLTDGKDFVRLARSADASYPAYSVFNGQHSLGLAGGCNQYNAGPPWGRPARIRVERRFRNGRDLLRATYSVDGKKWEPLGGPIGTLMPSRIKVGVFAEATAEGQFEVVFDQFQFRPLK
jgi:hypothetical protein